ncbi:TonB-dependent receptor [Asticcacaulis biprosthecium]|uniref:TonB-dependent receptor n=1 Tax=Asticcacaulis biprosthecium TaxID=76891 RepID=UPI0012F4B14C|nr:TonB-dependent receptor [Asticcacaulis biprosthecium]
MASLCVAAAAALAAPAAAQEAAQEAEVIVRGRLPVVEKADRLSYEVPRETPGILVDLLRTMPSVTVTPEGGAAVRGVAATILIDGKVPPEGPAAVRNLAAGDVLRIEVLTAPSAQYGNDGGVINIVTRKRRKVGGDLNLEGNTLTQGSVGLSGVMTQGAWTYHGRLFVDHYQNRSTLLQHQELPDGGGGYDVSDRIDRTRYGSDNATASLSAELALSETSEISFKAEHGHFVSQSRGLAQSRGEDVFDEVSAIKTGNRDSRIQAVYARSDDGQFRLAYDHNEAVRDFAANYDRDIGGGYTTATGRETDGDRIEGDYERRFGKRLLTAGFSLDRSTSRIRNLYVSRGVQLGVADFDTVFEGTETLTSAYATWQNPVGRWTFLPGLRVERQALDLPDGRRLDFVDALPSLHADRALGARGRLRLSLLRRVDRPPLRDYDETPRYIGAKQVVAGNPSLEPQVTNGFEARYSFDDVRFSASTTVYVRETRGDFSPYTEVLSNGLLMTTTINSGVSRSGGAEMTLRGTMGERITYSVNANLFYAEVPFEGEGGGAVLRGRTNGSGNALVEYRAGTGDRFQLNLTGFSRTQTFQGYSDGFYRADLSYTRQLKDRLSLVVSLNDAFNSSGYASVIDTQALRLVMKTRPDNRAFKLALAWKLGDGH